MIDIQTFLPWPDFTRSAKSLDSQRLGKQRVEGLQILNALAETNDGYAPSVSHHPATLMWKGHERALVRYITAICDEWTERGNRDKVLSQVIGLASVYFANSDASVPDWLGLTVFHENHRSRLLQKNYDWYKKRDFGPTPEAIGNLWPITLRYGKWIYMNEGKAVSRIIGIPGHQLVSEAMTQCSYCHYWWNRAELDEEGRCSTCISLREMIDMITELRRENDSESSQVADDLAEEVRRVIILTRQGRI